MFEKMIKTAGTYACPITKSRAPPLPLPCLPEFTLINLANDANFLPPGLKRWKNHLEELRIRLDLAGCGTGERHSARLAKRIGNLRFH
jgi:hypothetical protein